MAYRKGGVRAVPMTPASFHSFPPLGIAALEDKLVQRAAVEGLSAIDEDDFLGFSYEFRPGHSQHDAMDALSTAITRPR